MGFIRASAAASIRLRVWSVSGLWMVTKSDSASSSSSGVLAYGLSWMGKASCARMRMPKPSAMRATPRPITPKPMMPMVSPLSSKAG